MTTEVPQEFVDFVKEEVKHLQSDYPHANLSDAFTHWAGCLILPELDSDEIYDLVLGISGKHDKGVDLAYRDERNGIHYLFQTKYPNEVASIGPEPVRELFGGYELLTGNIETESLQIERIAHVASSLHESISRDFEIRFCLILFGELNDVGLAELETRTNKIPNATYVVYDIKELYDLHFTTSEVRYETGDIKLELPLFSDTNNIIDLDGIEPAAKVVNVDLVTYAKQVTQYIPRIFDANVRHPLKNKINRKIASTLLSPDDRDYFWHYNNGLTILANDFWVEDNILHVLGPTIVNGCQTTDTLSKTIHKLGNVATEIKLPLMIRFIKLKEEDSTNKLRVDIARYTNSQAPVVTPDFKSNEKEQERIAHLFTMLTPPVYYERKRGQWNALKPSEKKRYNDHVSMVNIAQRWYAFKVSPSEAITSKNDLFEDDGYYKEIFTPPRPVAEYYVAYLLFEQINKYLIDKKKQSEEKEDAESLFFLELARSKNLVVAHLIHLVGDLIFQKYKEIDGDTASELLKKVQSGEVVNSLEPVLVGVLETFNMLFMPEEGSVNINSIQPSLIKEWRKTETITKLQRFLNQQVSTFAKARINILDFV